MTLLDSAQASPQPHSVPSASEPDEKRCKGPCGELKPIVCFYRRRRIGDPESRQSVCIVCQNQRDRKPKQIPGRRRICTGCYGLAHRLEAPCVLCNLQPAERE